MKVDFMIIGAMKAGTSTIYDILKCHPGIVLSKIKEPCFFSHNSNWAKNINTYHELFNEEKGKIYGEASTPYTKYPKYNLSIWNDIYTYNNKMKFIYIVRNPIDRIISHYIQEYRRGIINESIEKSIKEYPEFINVSRYYFQIQPFIEKFGMDQVLILDFSDLIKKREDVIIQISDFLNIDFKLFPDFNSIHSNSFKEKKLHHRFHKPVKFLSPVLRYVPQAIKDYMRNILISSKRTFKEKPNLSEEYREFIINSVKLDIVELEKLTGKDYSHWLIQTNQINNFENLL